MELDTEIELYETDRPRIEQVAVRLREYVGTRRHKDAFVREVAERFAEQGYLVDVKLVIVGEGDEQVFHPTVMIAGRVDPEPEYDHERQQREMRAAVLGEPGPVAMPGKGGLWMFKGLG
jgi:hypothetical protein